jgi:hypothetical protein
MDAQRQVSASLAASTVAVYGAKLQFASLVLGFSSVQNQSLMKLETFIGLGRKKGETK